MSRWAFLFVALTLIASLTGCSHSLPPPPPPQAPVVKVGMPIERDVTDYEVFTGRTESAERVDIRARVTGYLEKAYFTDGTLIKEGDLLFLIDPRPYAAEVNRAEANLAAAKARLARIERDYDRGQPLVTRGTISREEFEKLVGDREEARAAVGVAESGVELARLNLKFTEVRSPFTGRVSRRMVDPGSLVKADETILTTVMALEPMYVYFDIDERTLLQLLGTSSLDTAALDKVPIRIGLSDEQGFPHHGVVNFVDNRVDPNTGTMWMRGEFIKPNRVIKPGIFSRIQFPVRKPYRAILVADQALGTDQGQKFLYVVGSDNKVEYRSVRVGRLQNLPRKEKPPGTVDDAEADAEEERVNLRVILSGLNSGERVVVNGLQRVRPGALVSPEPMDMLQPIAKAKPRVPSPAWPEPGATAHAGPAATRKVENGQ